METKQPQFYANIKNSWLMMRKISTIEEIALSSDFPIKIADKLNAKHCSNGNEKYKENQIKTQYLYICFEICTSMSIQAKPK